MERSRLLYKSLWAGLLLAVIMGTGFFAQKSMAEQKEEFLWTLAKADMAYGQDIVARIDAPRLNRYALVTVEDAPHGRTGRYAIWHGGLNSVRQQESGTGNHNRLITGASKGPFSFLRHLNEKDILIFQAAGNRGEERYLVTDFVMSEVPRVKIPALAEPGSQGETLLLATRYDYRNETEGRQLYLVVIARRIGDTA